MKAIVGYEEVAKIVEDRFLVLEKTSTEERKTAYKENKKKDCKATFLIHQCTDEAHLEKIVGTATSKKAWEIIEKCNESVE